VSDAPSPLVDRLRAYCLAKPGSLPSTPFGAQQPSYHILGGFLRYFARFFLEETPVRVKLRCALRDLEHPPQGVQLRLSESMRWGGDDWKWADLWLDETLDEAAFTDLLDRSYALCMADFDPADVSLINLAEQAPSPRDAIHPLIDLFHLTARKSEIDALIRPAILLRTAPVEASALSLGQSRIGGVPDLPLGWAYPTFDGKPLAFLAQINLEELPRAFPEKPLPSTGILYFFSAFGWQLANGDPHPDLPWERGAEAGFSQVLHFSGSTAVLNRHPHPPGMKMFKPAVVRFEEMLSLPRAADDERDPALKDARWSEAEFGRFDDLYFAFDFVLKRKLGAAPKHKLLGYADVIQAAVTQSDGRLLCQIDSDYHHLDTDMMWGDGGMIYFTLPASDLADGNFARIHSDLQSG
jgi:predicted DNA-binding protein (MmcQ/YjbR family)